MSRKHKAHGSLGDRAAGNGILNRRVFLENTLIAGAVGAVGGSSGAQAQPLVVARWMKEPGAGFVRLRPAVALREQGRAGRSRPRQSCDARRRRRAHAAASARRHHHAHRACTSSAAIPAFPDIDPDQHRLVIHGLVKRPLVFTLEALPRYPMQSRIAFIECAGNSQALNAPQAAAAQAMRRSTACSAARNGPA